MEHTAEPWRVEADAKSDEFFWIASDTETEIAMVSDGRIADANRIAACVNACAGISAEALDSWMNPPEGGFGHPHGPWPAHIISLQRAAGIVVQQRDDLVEAIRRTLDENGHLADGDVCTLKPLKDVLEKVGAGGTAPEGHNVRSQATDADLSRQVACTDGLCLGDNDGE